MMNNHNEGDDSPLAPDLFQQQTPLQNRKQNNERTTNKRPRRGGAPFSSPFFFTDIGHRSPFRPSVCLKKCGCSEYKKPDGRNESRPGVRNKKYRRFGT